MTAIARKFDGYRRRLIHEYSMFQHRRSIARKQRLFSRWLDTTNSKPPAGFVGPNFAKFGGVRGHINAIQRYSNAAVELFPPDNLMHVVAPGDMDGCCRDLLNDLNFDGISFLHSHVFPWFIEWCQERRSQHKFRWVHTYHLNYYPEHAANGVLKDWQTDINDALINTARHADVKLSVSKWQVSELSKEHGIVSEYLPNGVDVERCDKADAVRAKRRIGVENFVLYVGRNDPVKNPAEFVRLAQRLPETPCVMLGPGLTDEVIREEMGLVVPENLIVVGAADHKTTLDFIAACSVLVVTSRREGLPTLVIEGMALSKALVVSNEAGCVEAVGDGDFGLIYRQGDVDDLTENVERALTDGVKNQDARQRVLEEYDWRVIAPRLDAVYQGSNVVH